MSSRTLTNRWTCFDSWSSSENDGTYTWDFGLKHVQNRVQVRSAEACHGYLKNLDQYPFGNKLMKSWLKRVRYQVRKWKSPQIGFRFYFPYQKLFGSLPRLSTSKTPVAQIVQSLIWLYLFFYTCTWVLGWRCRYSWQLCSGSWACWHQKRKYSALKVGMDGPREFQYRNRNINHVTRATNGTIKHQNCITL